ncbi:MAG: DNA primase [Elusimicrobiota bacterium]|nr:DNA primase [Elusimicrobiota bacterium]
MNNSVIEKIRDSVDMLELIKEYVPAIKKAGRTYKACCPFHQEKTPSFVISPEKGLFYCFGCQAGGDIFAFLMRVENLSFNEAARKLAQRAGIEWQQEENMSQDEKTRLKFYKIMNFAKNFYHKQLMSSAGQAARAYVKQRNLTKQTAQKFELGLAVFDGLVKKALEAKIDLQDLKKLGLANAASGADYFKNRLMFPILNHRGETIAFGGRVMGEGQPKYLNSPETVLFSKSRVLYALNFAGPAIRKENRAILLEGYMDVIAAHQAGIENCVAPLGTSFGTEHAKLLKRYTSDIIVMFDPDNAGVNAALRAAIILVENGLYARLITLPDGLDPDEYIVKYGAEGFKNTLAGAKDLINFQADILMKGNEGLNPQQKANIAAELVETIKKQPDAIIKREWTRIAADRLNTEEDILWARVSQRDSNKPPTSAQTPPYADMPRAETDLIKLLLKFPKHLDVCNSLEEYHFKNKTLWRILNGIKNLGEEIPKEHIAAALAKEIPQEESLILKLSLEHMPQNARPLSDIGDIVKTIKKSALKDLLKQLQNKKKKYPAGEVPLDLLKEEIELQKEIKSY